MSLEGFIPGCYAPPIDRHRAAVWIGGLSTTSPSARLELADKETSDVASSPTAMRAPEGFFAARWRGHVAPAVLFWRDMIVVGTLINIATGFASLVALGLKAPLWLVWLIFLSPLPYNIFLCLALWHATARQPSQAGGTMRAMALVWLCIATLI